ncbi:hypothetical protein TIFTF001_021783 [Ficus carica]|uniref:Uncharacterized protein n=1 Tax=Ficus carica TaxID=3494 RepID=A0AA88DDX4_FICCA|nr:hypothetical protein TIFTF001_021783 [Ficus carica]
MWHALSQYGCQPVWDGVAGAAWADHPERDLVMVKKVLVGPVPWSPMVIYSRFSKESRDPTSLVRSSSSGGRIFSIGRAKEPNDSCAPRSPMNRWSPARERLHHQLGHLHLAKLKSINLFGSMYLTQVPNLSGCSSLQVNRALTGPLVHDASEGDRAWAALPCRWFRVQYLWSNKNGMISKTAAISGKHIDFWAAKCWMANARKVLINFSDGQFDANGIDGKYLKADEGRFHASGNEFTPTASASFTSHFSLGNKELPNIKKCGVQLLSTEEAERFACVRGAEFESKWR